ncbi:30S ribosomal protein S27 [Ignicoccus pacificus DSM 13166]|uniref:Small ribosomal subunit protein eS27 n=1 Tax=Ignicoccus pacificus DSM 13166 TaxID=940294 RepID=A0A977PJY2_9CREN|nr:30S ribosomal protein S27 [Ignicoccus pacificus DSM 13166]
MPRKRKLYKILTPEPRSRFIKVRCPTCGNEQVVFSHATYPASCLMCGTKLVEPTGGKARILGELVKILE